MPRRSNSNTSHVTINLTWRYPVLSEEDIQIHLMLLLIADMEAVAGIQIHLMLLLIPRSGSTASSMKYSNTSHVTINQNATFIWEF